MIFYSFVNMYLSGVQIGIQTAHAVAEIGMTGSADFITWANDHKTIVCLNGGDHNSLKEMYETFQKFGCMARSFEEPGLNNAVTAVGVLIPEKIYKAAKAIRERKFTFEDFKFFPRYATYTDLPNGETQVDWTYNPEEVELIRIINSCALAK